MRTQAAIDEFLHSCIAANLSPVTIAWYTTKLGYFANSCPKVPKKPGEIVEFLAGIQGEPETKHAYYRALKVFYRFFRRRYNFPNPIELIDPPRCPRKVMATLEADQTMRLLNSASNLRDRTILTLLVDTGMRSAEEAGLLKQDIKAETVIVRGKTGEREIPISDETRRLLLSLIASNSSEDDHVFQGHKGPLTRHGVYRIVSAHMIKAGIQGPKLGGHRIRHAFGKGYLVNGGDLRSLQEIMGHANITTTEKYTALAMHDVIEKHHKFSPLQAAHAAAQESFFDGGQAMKEAEEILAGKGQEPSQQTGKE